MVLCVEICSVLDYIAHVDYKITKEIVAYVLIQKIAENEIEWIIE